MYTNLEADPGATSRLTRKGDQCCKQAKEATGIHVKSLRLEGPMTSNVTHELG